MSDVFRPADRVVPSYRWSDRDAVFNLTGLPMSTVTGVLRQWALTPHLRAEIMRLERSVSEFARKHRISASQLKSMLNGHRLTSFDIYSFVLSTIGADHAPDEAQIQAAMRDAYARSEELRKRRGKSSSKTAAMSAAYGTHTSAASNLDESEPLEHPASALISAVLIQTLLADTNVQKHLAQPTYDADQSTPGLQVEVRAFVAPAEAPARADGFISDGLIAGRVWVPLDWVDTSYKWCGGQHEGVFVARVVEGGPGALNQFTGVRTVLHGEGDNPDIEFQDYTVRTSEKSKR